MQTIRTDTVQVGDSNIVFSVVGEIDDPALLLLHGWPHSRALYDGVIDQLNDDFFVLAPDLPGIGDSHGVPPSGEKTILVGAHQVHNGSTSSICGEGHTSSFTHTELQKL